ncbi:MAG TPA: RluA family pseudouridine synthase [bacterium]|nr:RluA family pseudouridine synthase [bacterium]
MRKVYAALEGERLDRVLQTLTGLSRKKAKSLLDQGRVKVNGRKVIIASWQMKTGDAIEVVAESMPTAEKYFLKVVYEDSDLLVVEKDAGIGCEPSSLAMRPSIVSIINAYLKRKNPHLKHHYLGLVHRLDRDTSGLMVYTKTKEANKITDQFKRHTIRRKYVAVVEGRIDKDQGRIEGFLKKSDLLGGGRKVALGTAYSGQKAVTDFRVLERYGGATLVEINLNTGRTHQIRVQMASIGHPVVGDRIYGKEEDRIRFPRQALHAAYLKFHHPVTGQKMEFSSELPKDMRKLVDRLRLQA